MMRNQAIALLFTASCLMAADISAADKEIDSVLGSLNGRMSKLAESHEASQKKILDETMGALDELRKQRLKKTDEEGAARVQEAMDQIREEFPEVLAGGPFGFVPAPLPPPETPPVEIKQIRSFKRLKTPNEVHKALKSLNPAYTETGRFVVEEGRIVEANLEYCNLINIAPLAALRDLRELNLGGNPLWDLSPIKNLKLTGLGIYGTDVRDLEDVKKFKLSWLGMSNTKIKDIAPVAKMPLTHLNIHNCIFIEDISPLKKCTGLRELTLPFQARNMDIEFLKKFKDIEFIDFTWSEKKKPASQFWKELKFK
ncbi:MAG: hypothetical protein JW808_00075 [Victivallales bacterium]|nr:hypothetical protein [Victivallales bacterium]